jgi:hypothetical protein
MGAFKSWLKLTEYGKYETEEMFSQKEKTQKSNISKLLGFSKPLKKFGEGSLATLYQHPTKTNLLIKVTAHKSDVLNIARAQQLNSPNIVKAYPWSDNSIVKDLPTIKSLAIIVEKIPGLPMAYTTSEFYDLSLNGKFELAADWLNSTLHKKQIPILDQHSKNNPAEHEKLASLFNTLSQLEKYRIQLSDFQDNIIDNGHHYVIIDMGF